MRNFMPVVIAAALAVFVLAGCTANQRARTFGGKQTVSLHPGSKLVTATWKDANLWYATRPMRPDEKPETITFAESSSWGTLEGVVVFVESKP